MIQKIISGGQTGADRAALDFAIEFNVPHGGWIPRGRLTEEGPLSEKYDLKEMPTKSYSKRTEQNVIDSDGTLIIARGLPTGGTKYTVEMVQKHKKPYICIDLDETSDLDAPSIISSWVIKQEIEVLNVAGPRASKDPEIYGSVKNIIARLYHKGIIESDGDYSNDITKTNISKLPRTVAEAVDQIIEELPFDDVVKVSRLSEQELTPIKLALRVYVQNRLTESGINEDLKASCCHVAGKELLDEVGASTVIIDELWKRLNGLKVVE